MSDCRLCLSSSTNEFYKSENELYWRCCDCAYIFLDPAYFISAAEEKARYQTHENHIHNKGYVNFLMPVIEAVETFAENKKLKILDYGCGPGPVLAELLRRKGHEVFLYDKFFINTSVEEFQTASFEAITCTEAFEHFHDPKKELEQMQSLLKPTGKIFIKTELFPGTNAEDFKNWYYKNDPTHVGFVSSGARLGLISKDTAQLI